MKNKRPALILADTIRLLKVLRLERAVSHEVLAEIVGVSRPAVSHIENGKRNPTLLMALRLAKGLDIELSSVLSEAEKLHPR